MYSHEVQAKIAIWRQKMAEGTISEDEMREIVLVLREGRKSAAAASEGARKKRAAVEIKSADEMLNELDNL